MDGWKPIGDETEAEASWRVSNRVKSQLGDTKSKKPVPFNKENTWGTVPMASKTISEMAASKMVFCDFPDDGSAHVCPQEPTTIHRLMSIKQNGKTYNCCFHCWLNKCYSETKALEQFAQVGGYKPD